MWKTDLNKGDTLRLVGPNGTEELVALGRGEVMHGDTPVALQPEDAYEVGEAKVYKARYDRNREDRTTIMVDAPNTTRFEKVQC